MHWIVLISMKHGDGLMLFIQRGGHDRDSSDTYSENNSMSKTAGRTQPELAIISHSQKKKESLKLREKIQMYNQARRT